MKLALLALAPSFASAAFSPQVEFPALLHGDGGAGSALFAGDFDRDGTTDVVSVGSQRLQIFRGDGQGGFAAREPVPGSDGLAAIELRDFDGDGWLDVLAARTLPAGLVLALGDATGGLRTPVAIPGGALRLVQSADFDADGQRDVAAWSDEAHALRVFRRTPNGFMTASTVSLDTNALDLACGDFDRDGRVDAALGLRDGPGVNRVVVLRGDGQGGFAGRMAFVTAVIPSVESGDADGDGFEELLVTAYGAGLDVYRLGTSGAFVSRHVDGEFEPHVPRGDFDADGDLDLLARFDFVTHVLRNDGTGSFARAEPLFEAGGSDGHVVAELNGDGALDFVSPGANGTFLTVMSDGRGGWGRHRVIRSDGPSLLAASGDLDGDGFADLVLTVEGALQVWRGEGAGSFALHARVPSNLGSPELELRDLDHDGDLDLVARLVGQAITTHLNDGSGRLAAGVATPWSARAGDLFGDFDGDLAIDLLQLGPALEWHRGDGAGGFGATSATPLASPVTFALAVARDFDGDGRDDVCLGRANALETYFGSASGNFSGPASTPIGELPWGLCTGDFDGDGRADVAYVRHQESGLILARGDGGGRFPATARTPLPEWAESSFRIVVARFDRDLLDDIGVLCEWGGIWSYPSPLSIFLGRASGSFSPPTSAALGYGIQRVVAGDFDLDGRADLAVHDVAAERQHVVMQR